MYDETAKRFRKKAIENMELPNMLHELILDGMRNVLGENGMKATLHHLQLTQYAWNPKEFHDKLYWIFRDGAIIIEKMIVMDVFLKLGIPYEERRTFDFDRYLNSVKEILSNRPIEKA